MQYIKEMTVEIRITLVSVNTNLLKAKLNRLQSVRLTITLLTAKTVDFMITVLDGKD